MQRDHHWFHCFFLFCKLFIIWLKHINGGDASDLDWLKCLLFHQHILFFLFFLFSPLLLLALSSHIYSSPGYDRTVFLRLHVVIKVHVHRLFSADMKGWRKDVSAPASKVLISLLLLHAFVNVKLFPLGNIHFTTQENIACGRRIRKMTVMIFAGLFHQCPGGIATFPICVDGPVVVCACPVLSSSAEEQPSFITIITTVTAAAAGRYRLPAAGVAVPLLPLILAQENANKRDDQKQGQEGANHGTCHHASTEWLFQSFYRRRREGG